MRTRVAIAVPGVLLGLYGIFRLLTEIPGDDLLVLAVWLLAAVVLHDGVLSPLLVGIGWAIAKVVPPRGRRYLQGALIAGGLITVVALPLIHRERSQPASKAILQQDYALNLAVLLALVTLAAAAAYAVRVVRDRQRLSATNVRPPDDQDSATA
ncbi:hypothetical protein SAMN05443575_4181 [Jatrophihabitans endophyticus]|uniref:Uncharacterized protein n=1 Tax=Jatrophihabitans endophyticus TaxID=1206085 RepID=A0A1M5UDU0_9ACTN|nr:hypothetical protein [Jatrophihabitans endophyticus]SHH61068.1 hypothetical protein SAMN05443575_4181 [Jatrophihabitans endophyticus]